ncbi:hypothetical protein [Paraflavitalea speifideaquila]|uniref:hypothetical protein n=1 Tax=Paraflavitalea speifideaquila TaxID=3076558 RepID=UPI0028EDE775|nr:hypothetical protein [Paraflavitalea speifideiaquila]
MKLNNCLLSGAIFVAAFTLTGCLKEADTAANKILNNEVAGIVELLRTGQGQPAATSVYSVAVAATPAEENLLLGYVRFNSSTLPVSQVKVKLKLNNAALPATVTALPGNAYSFVTPLNEITIEPGTRMAPIRIILKKNLITPGLNYGLRLEIEDAGGNGNLISPNVQILSVSLRVPR